MTNQVNANKYILPHKINSEKVSYNYSAGAISLLNGCDGYYDNWILEHHSKLKFRILWANLDFSEYKLKKWTSLKVLTYNSKINFEMNDVKNG